MLSVIMQCVIPLSEVIVIVDIIILSAVTLGIVMIGVILLSVVTFLNYAESVRNNLK